MRDSYAKEKTNTVYFVVSSKHLEKRWPELLAVRDPAIVSAFPERITSGRDCWVVKTWAHLHTVNCPFKSVLATEAVDDAVCVFHWDDANLVHGLHRSYAVVVQADRPAPPLADRVVVQNDLGAETAGHVYIPLWLQPGLIPRDVRRGTRVETIAYFGSSQYEPPFMEDADFHEALTLRGVAFSSNLGMAWHDYAAVDVVLAVRNCPPVVLATKPASKLVNAWQAGVPALLGSEPAYHALRASPLDFLEVRNAADVLHAIDQLRASPALYADMVANGCQRAEAFADAAIVSHWTTLLTDALDSNRCTNRNPAWRAIRFRGNKCAMGVWKRLVGWND